MDEMLAQILQFLSPDRLPSLPGFLTLSGSIMALYNAQMTSWASMDDDDAPFLQWINRGARLLLSAVLFWLFIMSQTGDWGPYPPTVILIIALDLQLLFRSLTLIFAHRSKTRGASRINVTRHLADEPFFRNLHRPHRGHPSSAKHH